MENKYYTDPDKIGKFIRHLRESHNLTQDQLGKKLFITRKAISKWETGKAVPSLEMMHDIADVFGVNFNEIVEGEFEKDTSSTHAKFKKIAKRILSVILTLSILTLLIFFYENRNSTVMYKINYVDEVFLLTEGNFVISNDTINFKMGTLTCYDSNISNNPNYEFELYYKNSKNETKEIVKFNSINFNYNEKENNKLDIKSIKENIDNLYLKVTYENTSDKKISYDLHLLTEKDDGKVEEEKVNYVNDNNLQNRSTPNSNNEKVIDSAQTEINLSFLYELSEDILKKKLNNKIITIDNQTFEIVCNEHKNINLLNKDWKVNLDLNANIFYIKIYTNTDTETYCLSIKDNRIILQDIPNQYHKQLSGLINEIQKTLLTVA